jgi:tRNA uridine 5-carboxymethylaminomethyl modification enzyme
VAGINCHFKAIDSNEVFVPRRDEAYIGVLIDDLISKGVDEPYRMFTSRAEYRILLRQDNADERLTEKGYKIGLAKEERLRNLESKLNKRNELIKSLEENAAIPDQINEYLEKKETSPIKEKTRLIKLVGRPQVKLLELLQEKDIEISRNGYDLEVVESAEIEIKYKGYIEREKQIAEKIRRLENITIKENFDYDALKSISTEARQKLNRLKPGSIAQASRISGVSPSDINVILVHLGR